MRRLALLALIPALLDPGCGRERPVPGKSGEGAAPADGATQAPGPAGEGGPAAIDEGSVRPRGPARSKDREPDLPRFPVPAAGQMVSIPGGALLAGSAPEDTLRIQFAENDQVPHEMTLFQIDALPFPNDPARPFLTGQTRSQAEAACQAAGKRLCTELEWERACKGAANLRYPTGDRYDPAAWPAGEPLLPHSAFGVFAMGRILEWTSSRWGAEPDQVERASVRGFAEGFEEPPVRGRRCAKRWRRMPDGADPALGFRCCRGKANAAACFLEPPRPPFSVYTNMKGDKFAAVIRSIGELADIHDNPRMFSDADIRAVLARRSSDKEALGERGVVFEWKPVRWIPRQGTELWVAVGRTDRHSFVVALHEVEDNEKYVHASSLILWNTPVPLALAYLEGHRDALFWAPCWNCRDGGQIAFDDEKNEVIITHKW